MNEIMQRNTKVQVIESSPSAVIHIRFGLFFCSFSRFFPRAFLSLFLLSLWHFPSFSCGWFCRGLDNQANESEILSLVQGFGNVLKTLICMLILVFVYRCFWLFPSFSSFLLQCKGKDKPSFSSIQLKLQLSVLPCIKINNPNSEIGLFSFNLAIILKSRFVLPEPWFSCSHFCFVPLSSLPKYLLLLPPQLLALQRTDLLPIPFYLLPFMIHEAHLSPWIIFIQSSLSSEKSPK